MAATSTSNLQPAHNAAHPSRLVLLRRWLIGLLGSWCIVWFAAPWALNSILVRDKVPELGTIGLRVGDEVRWRSEGWATTRVGRYGLSGYQPRTDAPRTDSPVIAIYGDSQVEGHCVNDADKICNQVVQLTEQKWDRAWDCVPLARSGAAANTWVQWLPRVEKLMQPRWHVWIVTELSDLDLDQPRESTSSDVWSAPSPLWIRTASDWHAAALFTIARRLALDHSTGQTRHLRFSPGKVTMRAPEFQGPDVVDRISAHTAEQLRTLNDQLRGRLVILYSPAVPAVDPGVQFDARDPLWEDFAMQIGDSIRLIDLRPEYDRLWQEKHQMPRGFHNGQPYSGHLNRAGNSVIAQVIVERLLADTPVTVD